MIELPKLTRHLRAGLLACAALGATALSLPALAQTQAPIVRTASGPVQATVRDGMRTYFAIPYAAPPVGDLRWRAPRPAASWADPIAKTKSGAACLQTGAAAFRSSGDSEDCLYLDVHTPAGPGPFPVMVWIHGGAFTSGSAGVYADPTPLVSKGVIVVAINYRLGAMGFMALPALRESDGSAGNYGIMDQQAALGWVQKNISSFGGDPKNVTIFGESAGGFSVMSHLAAPGSAGLFQKAIIESGAYGVSGQLTQAELEALSTEAVNTTLTRAGLAAPGTCTVGTPSAACLRDLPEPVIRAMLMSAFASAVPNIMPSVDGRVLPRTIKATFVAGANNKVPVINGSNQDENLLFLALQELAARFSAKPPNFDPTNRSFLLTADGAMASAKALEAQTGISANDLLKKHYPLSAYGSDTVLQPSLAAGAAGTDSTFSCNGINVSARMIGQGSPVWMYEFRDQSAPSLVGSFGGKAILSLPQGAAHATELSYIFNLMDLGSGDRKALKDTMSGYWANFAKSGNPNGAGLPAWGAFKGGQIQALDVASDGGVKPMPIVAFRTEHKCDSVWGRQTF